jgi:hypothetical protein
MDDDATQSDPPPPAPSGPQPPSAAGEPQLLVGQIPDPWAAELPLPDVARVAGSLVIGDRVTVVLDCPLAAAGALEFYRGRLPAAGWTDPGPLGPHGGGFVHSGGRADPRALFCRGEGGPALWVIAAERGPGRTEVRLELDTFASRPEQSPCARRRAMGYPRRPMGLDRMPALLAPVGAEQRSEGGGGGDEQAYSSATVQTDLDLPALGAHYARQLERAGWTRTGEGADGPTAWSTWSFADDEGRPWRAVFVALRLPDIAGRPFLVLHAESVGASGLGGFASTSFGSYGTPRG